MIKDITVILIEPENSGNTGAIARSMANFGFKRLLLINPKIDHLSKEALDRSVHAKDILQKAIVTDISGLDNFDYLIATTAKLGTDYNIPRLPITPDELGNRLNKIKGSNIGIVIGRESSGLKNSEIKRCDFICSIPADKRYPTMNISHATTILLYELFTSFDSQSHITQTIPAGKKEKDAFFKELNGLFESIDFITPNKKKTQEIVWQRLIGKSFLTKRELFALFGFIRKLKDKID